MIGRIFCLAVIFILNVSGCSEDSDPISLTPPPTGVEITLSVSPTHIRIGQRAEVTLTVTNHGPDPIELDFQCVDHLGYKIKAVDGSFTFSSPGLCEIGPYKLRLEPGRSQSLQKTTSSTLAPQTYIVSGGILEHEEEFSWATSSLIVHW